MSKSRTGAPDGDDDIAEMTSRSIGGVPEALIELLLLGFNCTSWSEKQGPQEPKLTKKKNPTMALAKTVTFFRFQWGIAK